MFMRRLAKPMPVIFAESLEWPMNIMFERSIPMAMSIVMLAGSATDEIAPSNFERWGLIYFYPFYTESSELRFEARGASSSDPELKSVDFLLKVWFF